MTDNNIIDKLVNMTQNINNKPTNYDLSATQIKEIKKKFPQLKNAIYTQPIELEVGTMIRYVDREFSKLSTVGIIKNIEYMSLINTNNIKAIYLYDPFSDHKAKWRINPKQCYIFKCKFPRPKKDKTKDLASSAFSKLENIDLSLFEDDIKEYLKGLKEDGYIK